MANPSNAVNRRCGSDPCTPTPKVCPDCGALECLCRPRFFAGQLLTEQDLNLLDQYIKKKHRLHNRNLHGWGVVNGLLVLCDPCGQVKVTPGYALSPCGDDIVVCEESAVDICALIRACVQAERGQTTCRPHQRRPDTNCGDLEEEWILAIRYREWASRGVTPLRADPCATPVDAGCGCGGAQSKPSLTHRGAPAECEPTQVCEGFYFEVYRKPQPEPTDDDRGLLNPDSDFSRQLQCCVQPLLDAIPDMPQLGDTDDDLLANAQALVNWCCRLRANLMDYFSTQRNVRCEIIDALQAIRCPVLGSDGQFVLDFLNALLDLLAIWAEGLKNCLCLALLPPAPEPTSDQRVPLASVRIRARNCHILSICNWSTERKILVTWPAIGHWLGIFSIGETLHELVDRFCCNSLLDIFDALLDDPVGDTNPNGDTGFTPSDNLSGPGAQPAAGVNASAAFSSNGGQTRRFALGLERASGAFGVLRGPIAGPRNLGELSRAIYQRGDQSLDLGRVLNGVTRRFKLPTGGPELSEVERANLPLVLAAEVLGKPLLENLRGGAGEAPVDGARFEAERPAEAARAPDLAQVQAEMRRMQAVISDQETRLQALRRRLDGEE